MSEPKLEDFFKVRSEKNELSATRDKLEVDIDKPDNKKTMSLGIERWLQQRNQLNQQQ